jgi:predicted metal-binding protein
MPYLLFSCKRVSAIISVNPSERTSKERFILNYHKFVCKACHNYQYQNAIIEDTLSKSLKADTLLKLSAEKKALIIEYLNRKV